MKKAIQNFGVTIVALVTLGMASCKKEDGPKLISEKQQLLTAKTWQVSEVNEMIDGEKTALYKKGAANNEEDYSLVRQSFKADGKIHYTDQFGDQGTDGLWKLLDNDTRLQLSLLSMGITTIVDDFTISSTGFSYKLKTEGSNYVEFKFIPVQ
jgi:hypothetical protein